MYPACDVCGIAHDPMKLCELRHVKAFMSGTLGEDLGEDWDDKESETLGNDDD